MTILQVFLPFAFGYFLSYLLRVVNAVIAPDLIAEMGLTASDLGLLTSVNFFAFGLCQLPVGVLLDRFGPRKTEACLLLVAAAGALVFGMAGDTAGLIVGRAMIGMGTSACLMGAFKAYTHWVRAERLPLVNGFQMFAGGLGALSATRPVEMALAVTDWRGVFMVIAAITLTAAVTLFMVVPRRDRVETTETWGQQIDGIRRVFASPAFWRIAPVTIVAQSSFLGIQSLWSGPWLRDVAGMAQGDMADGLFLIAVFMLVGFLSQGALGDRLGRAGINPMTVSVVGMALFAASVAAIALRVAPGSMSAWMAFGLLGPFAILPYAVLPQAFPKELTGRVITGLNVLVFLGAFSAQWGIGAIINLWPEPAPGHFAPEGYRAAFLTVAAIQAAGIVWYLVFTRTEMGRGRIADRGD